MANNLSLKKLDVFISKRDCHNPAKSVTHRNEKRETHNLLNVTLEWDTVILLMEQISIIDLEELK